MFSIVELKTALLDSGIPGISPLHMMLLFLLIAAAPMIPYFFLYRSLRDEEGTAPKGSRLRIPMDLQPGGCTGTIILNRSTIRAEGLAKRF